MFDRSVSLFLIPKKSMAKIGAWVDILVKMSVSPVDFLSEYFHRNVCKSGFSADKGRFGRIIRQKERTDNRQRSSQTLFSTISMQ
jgi:transposase